MRPHPQIKVLLVEDDEDHYFLIKKIWKDAVPQSELVRVEDGEELMDYLTQAARMPDLVILDINMPRKDGWEVLAEMKADPRLRPIPIVVLTTSETEEDKSRSYDMGASSYIRKPVEFKDWVETFKALNRYWFEIVDLPARS